MPTNISGRVISILFVLAGAFILIFPPGKVTDPTISWSQKHDLRPGIDMVGGTSLLYEIKTPPGAGYDPDLANQVMTSLKKRVDPDGVRNLIWRPQGATRLEIQMPLSAKSGKAKQAREEFAEAQRALEATNLRYAEVSIAIETLRGDQRQQRIEALAMGSPQRLNLLNELAATWDQIEQARAQQDAAAQAVAEEKYDTLRDEVLKTNLGVTELQNALESRKEVREQRLAEMRAAAAEFEARQRAIDQFIEKYQAFSEVKASIDDASDLKRLLQGSGVLEFHILATDVPPSVYQEMVERLDKLDTKTRASDTVAWFPVDRPEELGYGQIMRTDPNGKVWVLAYITPDKSMTNRDPTKPKWTLESARAAVIEGERKVEFRFDTIGARLFGQLTGANVGRPLAIMLDDRVISAPNINQQIHGQGVIEGGGREGFSRQEVTYLASTLNAGALPAQLTEEPISERTVGPQLGQDNLRRGLYACYFGLGVVALFLIGYYYLAGVVAMFAVLMNLALILGAMAGLNATFTLASIAGIVLTIGMAVDANVLIFERLREEQVRGLSLRMAMRNAYDRAWAAIFDANLTTAITAAALYIFGSEEVRGFGLTLLLGIVSSMFTALYVTKTIFAIMIDKFGIEQLSSLPLTFPKWDRMLKPNIDWMGKAWAFYAFSTIFIVVGCIAFSVKWAQGRMLDIEFASGTSVQFELKQPMPIEEVRRIIDNVAKDRPQVLPAPGVVSVGDDGKTYEIVTPNPNASQVREAILTALQGRLNIREKAAFDLVGRSFADAQGQAVIPIERSTTAIAGLAPEELRAHVGGVAIVLKNLSPPLSAEEIRQRVEQQRLQPQAGGGAAAAARFTRFDVATSADGSTALIMTSDPDLPYSPENDVRRQRWTDELAGPTWTLVNDAIAKPPTLQKVTNFDAQVAGETQQQAIIALLISTVAVVAYIWLRFGNFKYGVATIIALAHDVLFTLGAIGFAHYLANTAIGDALLIEPFRINLTLVAAILTIMGYSLNDSVVIFDRIRENRGKLGHVDRAVINDSINQTLSRTLLTGGTTIVTILMMYITGGAGIHGFTFALLVGIVVGTYSSVAIACPILLWQRRAEQSRVGRPVPTGQLQRA